MQTILASLSPATAIPVMPIPFTPLVQGLPASIPFTGPEVLERERGTPFKARLGANESAFGISPLAAQALHDHIGVQGCSWYGDAESAELRDLLAARHGISADCLCVDAGIDSLLGLAVRMMVEPGTRVVTSLGAYPTFNYHVNGFGGHLLTVPYRNNHEDCDALLATAKSESARLLYLSNPDNPMGTCHTAETIQSMIDAIPDGCMFLLDEAYADFLEEQQLAPIDVDNQKLIRFRTFSKAYGMAGMRIGYAIAHPEIISGFNRIRNHFAVNKLAQLAAAASLRDQQMLPEVRTKVEHGRQFLYALADDLKLACLPSSTNFVAIDFCSADLANTILSDLNRAGVFLRKPMVSPLDSFIRVGVGTAAELEFLADKLHELLAAIRK